MSATEDSDSDSDFDVELFPIISGIDDSDTGAEASDEREDTENEQEDDKVPDIKKPPMTLRQRRMSKSLATINALLNVEKALPTTLKVDTSRAHRNWMLALRKAKLVNDPWAGFHIENITAEKCIRHRYHPHKSEWVQDHVIVKMESKPFNRGAMRECFRLKKNSSFTHNSDWHHAGNYVAKRYLETVNRDVYFQDVKLQMDAKVWAEEYNRHNPPKKVDIIQMYILEFQNRPGSPLYHLEHYIEGNYVKYNSNSGFVEETLRYTPQAISHFTFERSGHKLIVVDIQGVGDLYTDPQIHTIDGKEYGDGNLGAKGMALFFHSHICNEICHGLELTEFDLSPLEINFHKDFLRKQRKSMMKTRVRGKEEHCISLTSPEGDKIDITRFLERQRSNSSIMSDSAPDTSSPGAYDTDEPMSIDSPIFPRCRVRVKSVSESDSQSSMTADEEKEMFQKMAQQRARPSCVAMEKDFRKLMNFKIGDSTLGKIHHEMAKYHEIGRFCITEKKEDEIDWESAIFHEEHAAELGELEAILTMARLYLGLQKDVLVNCTVEQSPENTGIGFDYMVEAAEAGDRGAMVFVATAFESGINLGPNREMSWEDAVYWYEQAMSTDDHDEGGEFNCIAENPEYQLKAKVAELFQQGGHGLDKDPQRAGDLYTEAADAAMAAMKGRLANKYYTLAEEAWGEMEE